MTSEKFLQYKEAFEEYGELLPQDESEYDFGCLTNSLNIDYVPNSEEFKYSLLLYCKNYIEHFRNSEDEYNDDWDDSKICYACKRPKEVKEKPISRFKKWHDKYDSLLEELV